MGSPSNPRSFIILHKFKASCLTDSSDIEPQFLQSHLLVKPHCRALIYDEEVSLAPKLELHGKMGM